MKLDSTIRSRDVRAYTLAEVMVAVGIGVALFVTLYLGFAASFAVIQNARENLRATQILMQRMETLRLYTWDQLNDANYVRPVFTEHFAPLGVTYHGRVEVRTPTQLGTPSYLNHLRTVQVSITWTNAGRSPTVCTREMTTQVARFGLQNYVFGLPSTK